MSVSKRAYFTKKLTDEACRDDTPIRKFWRHEVTPKVGCDRDTMEFPNDILTQANNILESIDRVFKKANLSIGRTYSMNVWVRNMRNKKDISNCIRKYFISDPKSPRTTDGPDELFGVIFRYADFEDERVHIMMDATEYNGR